MRSARRLQRCLCCSQLPGLLRHLSLCSSGRLLSCLPGSSHTTQLRAGCLGLLARRLCSSLSGAAAGCGLGGGRLGCCGSCLHAGQLLLKLLLLLLKGILQTEAFRMGKRFS